MDKVFKKVDGEIIEDLPKYIIDYINSQKEDITIYVGTDSMVYRKTIGFVVAIVLYKEGKGGHLLYHRFHVPKKGFIMQTRLLKEVETSIEVANFLDSKLDGHIRRTNVNEKLIDIDLDLNPDFGNGKNKSNSVYQTGLGWAKGEGFRVRCKPYAHSSSSAADILLKRSPVKNKRKGIEVI